MGKCTNFVGIDISKDTFDSYCIKTKHQKMANEMTGFKSLLKQLPPNPHVVMEATGSYHQQLAKFLYSKKINVSIVNPLSVKRFIQMKLKKNKTDKSDAKMIAWFGKEQCPKLWKPNHAYIDTCTDIQTTIGVFQKQQTSCKNKLHSLNSKGIHKGALVRSINRLLKSVSKEIIILEKEIGELVKKNEPKLLTNLKSIPGIGLKTALLLISSTNSFSSFENYRQVSAYFGLAPQHFRSGTSVHAKSRITKTGNPRVRNHLFLCSFTASIYNPQCKALYERITNKGKSKKLALIAVCNKLIKQAFAISKSGLQYDPCYVSIRTT